MRNIEIHPNNGAVAARHYQKLIKDLWSKERWGSLVPAAVLNAVRFPAFRGLAQQVWRRFFKDK